MHADATALPFGEGVSAGAGFDGVWTVQVFQHIPDFARACSEAHRVLRPGGRFANYSLHITPLYRLACKVLGKPFHVEGMVKGAFYLARASDAQRDAVRGIFGGPVNERYTEYLFHTGLRMGSSGACGSLFGRLDAALSDAPLLGKLIGRQRSFEAIKR